MKNIKPTVFLTSCRIIVILAILLLYTGSMSAYAEKAGNPWAKRYSQQQLNIDNLATETLPPTLQKQTDTDTSNKIYSISYADVEKQISYLLAQAGAGDIIQATIIGKKSNDILLQNKEPLAIDIADLEYNTQSNKWHAMLYPTVNNRALAPIKLNGIYTELVAVPVAKTRLRNSDIITAEDIEIKNIAAHRISKDTIINPELLIGKSPVRSISAGRAIRNAEITAPNVIHKGDRVTMQYHSSGIDITTIGEALESGASGDIIRVRNSDSNNVIHAAILSAGIVTVAPANMLMAAQQNKYKNLQMTVK